MADETTITVNFGRPMPVFPLGSVKLLPHGVLPVSISEPRYRQMVSDAIDGAGQIALAVLENPADEPGAGELVEGGPVEEELDSGTSDESRPPLRTAVCIGQIVRHERFPDGQYLIWLQGICRAQITHELPASDAVPYRRAMLEPVGLPAVDEEKLKAGRDQIGAILSEPPMTDLRDGALVVQHLADEEVPTSAILELITLAFLPHPGFRYRFLAEGDAVRRCSMVVGELGQTRGLLRRASSQRLVETPKGCSWN